jgi:hypothetical protein
MGTAPYFNTVLPAAGLKALPHRAAHPPLPPARGDGARPALDIPLTAAVAPFFYYTSRRRRFALTSSTSEDSPQNAARSLGLAGSAPRPAVFNAHCTGCVNALCCTPACMLAPE